MKEKENKKGTVVKEASTKGNDKNTENNKNIKRKKGCQKR